MAERRPRRRSESRRTERNRSALSEAHAERENARLHSRRRRKKKSGILPFLFGVLLLLLIGGVGYAVYLEKYAPSTEWKDRNEWFETSGSRTRIYLNDVIDRDTTAVAENGNVYLPLSYVQDKLNGRFYWGAEDGELIYTLPDEVVRATESAQTEDGAPVFLLSEDGEPLLNLSVVQQYTDLRYAAYAEETESAKRVFIYNDWSPAQAAETKRDVRIRTKGGVKAPILTEAAKGTELKILERMDQWSRVLSPDGVIGYVQNRYLKEAHEQQFSSSYQAPEFVHQTLPEKAVLGWHLVLNKTAAMNTLDSYTANTNGVMNVICPTGIQIDGADGSYQNFIDGSYVQKAHEKGLQVWVMVDNFNQPGGVSDFSTKTYFSRAENRAAFIGRLMEDAERYGYDGYNLDFEGIPTDAGPAYVQFYRELSVACRARGLVLSIDNYVPYQFNDYYRLEEQADFADYVVIMGYDEHTQGSSEAGSVASIGYTRFGIEETLKRGVSPEHVIHGVPFFTRLWKRSGTELSSDAMGINEAKTYVETAGIQLDWDADSGQYYGRKETETGSEEIWLEEERSVAEKAALIREYGLGGVAGWRLNFEPADVWEALDLNGVLQTAGKGAE